MIKLEVKQIILRPFVILLVPFHCIFSSGYVPNNWHFWGDFFIMSYLSGSLLEVNYALLATFQKQF